MFNNDDHKDRDYCCTPPVRKAGPYCGPVDTTPVGKPYNSHADCYHKPDCGYHIPPVPPFPPGTSLEFQMQALNQKMDELICKYNGCVDNYESVRNELLNSFCCNEAYYNEIWTENYLDPTMNTNVHVVHIPFVDKCGRPIRLELGLAYDNTGNIGATEEAYHASKRVLADKLFPANFTEKDTKAFVGPCIWNGVPYNFGNPVSQNAQLVGPTSTLGITRSGFLKVYPITTDVRTQSATIEQMQRDGIENAMDCLSYVLDSKPVDSPVELSGPFVGVGMDFSTKERVIILVSVTPNAVSGDAISGLFTKYHCTVGVITCWGETASLMDKGQFVAMPATVETSSTNPATQIVPYYNSFWYISKSEYYNSEYTKEVADLMQDVGALEWKYNMSMVAIESNNRVVAELNQKIETEIKDREAGDDALGTRITQEVADLNSRIDQEVKTLNESIATVQKNLDDAVETINSRIDSEVEKLNQAIQAEETRAEAAESSLDEKIQAETTRATEAETNLDNKIQAETTRATEAENDLDEKIDAETTARQEAVNSEAATRAANDIVSVELIQDGTKNTYRLKTGGETYLEVPIELYDYALLVSKMQDLTNVQQNLAAEVEARQTADDEIRASVTKEASTRQTEDTKLQNQIDGLTEKQDGYVLKAGDTMTGDLNMGTHKVTGLATPTGNTDAANKEYVDNAVSGDYLPTTGGTMTGDIDMNGNTIENVKDPVNAQDAANKEYVDAIGEGVGKNFLPTAGGTMSGGIDMNGNAIQNVKGPENAKDAVNKEYVDNATTELDGKFLPLSGGTMTGGIDMKGKAVTNASLMSSNDIYVRYLYNGLDMTDASTPTPAVYFGTDNVAFGHLTEIDSFTDDPVIVKGVDNPTDNNDAANKKYVDDAIKGIDLSGYLPLAGGTMSGDIDMSNNTISRLGGLIFGDNAYQLRVINGKFTFWTGGNTDADIQARNVTFSTLNNGDSEGKLAILLANNQVQIGKYQSNGDISVNGSGANGIVITGVGTPKNGADVTNKKYVDDAISGINLSGYLPLSGGTMTGTITFDGIHGISMAGRIGMSNNTALISVSDSTGIKGIKFSDEGNSFEATYFIADYISNGLSNDNLGFSFTSNYIYAGKFNSNGEFVDGTSGSGPVIRGIGTPTDNYDATNKQYVDTQINTVPVTTPITIFPLSTGNLSLVSQNGKIEDKTGVIYATAQYRVVTEISGGVRIALQNTVSGGVIPSNITGVVNACNYNDGPGMMTAMKAAFYQGWTYLYTDGTLPIGEFIYINFMGFKEV